MNEFQKLLMELNVPFTFSRYCISGLVEDCKCRRCLTDKGETPTFRTELAAARRSKIESKKFHERTLKFIEKFKNDE